MIMFELLGDMMALFLSLFFFCSHTPFQVGLAFFFFLFRRLEVVVIKLRCSK